MRWPWSKTEPVVIEPTKVVVYDICPNCRVSIIGRFCNYCGTEGVKPKCEVGHSASVGDNFCMECGIELKWGKNPDKKAQTRTELSALQLQGLYGNAYQSNINRALSGMGGILG